MKKNWKIIQKDARLFNASNLNIWHSPGHNNCGKSREILSQPWFTIKANTEDLQRSVTGLCNAEYNSISSSESATI